MPKESCITHPANSKVVVIKEYYIKLCEEADNYKRADRYCAAMLLSQFEYWMNVKLPNKKQAEFENKLAEKEDLEPTQNESLWVWKTQDDLSEELFNMYSSKKIGHSLKWLVEQEFLLRRKNPKYKWDNTYQYIINIDEVQNKINDFKNQTSSNTKEDSSSTSKETNVSVERDTMSYSKETNVGYDSDKCRSPERQMSETIPEITTEVTSNDSKTFSSAEQNEIENKSERPPFEKIIKYLNLTTDSKFSTETKNTRKLIRLIYQADYKFEHVKEVIDKKFFEWAGTEYEQYLRPQTLFKLDKFESYLNQPWPKKNNSNQNKTSKDIETMEAQGWN